MEKVAAVAGQSAEAVEAWLARIDKSPDVLPQAEAERDIDFALASLAIELGLLRHAGTLEQLFTPMGIAYQQTGKDLTRISQLILTGGALIHARPELAVKMAERAMETGDCPSSLMPRKAGVLIDSRYILSAMGLLSVHHPELARKMMKKEFDRHGVTQ